MHQVVIVGAGFGGLRAAKALGKAPVQVVLIDRRNFHLFQPLLYQVATGGLSPANIASPVRAILKRQKNVRVWLGEMIDLDLEQRRVVLHDREASYDTLIIATGARHHYFGHPEWEPLAPGLKTIEDATEIRRRILVAFEAAERETERDQVAAWLTFVIVGAGPTGVELAGAVAELAEHTLRGNFRNIDPAKARILLVEGLDRVLHTYPPDLSSKAEQSLVRLGVTVRTGCTVTELRTDGVAIQCGTASEWIPSRTVLWAAGVQASNIGKILAVKAGAQLDRAGRVMVGPDLAVPGHPEIFVIGDLACFIHQGGQPLPGIAPVAMQQGAYAAATIVRRICNEPSPPFHYRELGNMATIGRSAAVADLGWIHLSGMLAWLAWLFIHLIKLIGFANRFLVLGQWAWNYFTGIAPPDSSPAMCYSRISGPRRSLNRTPSRRRTFRESNRCDCQISPRWRGGQ